MKISPFRLLISTIVLLFPVVLWNVIYLEHIDKTGKLIAWLLTAPIAFMSTGIFQGFEGATKGIKIKDQINPFWGWFIFALAIEIFITLLSNT